jgi:hypothetical protein
MVITLYHLFTIKTINMPDKQNHPQGLVCRYCGKDTFLHYWNPDMWRCYHCDIESPPERLLSPFDFQMKQYKSAGLLKERMRYFLMKKHLIVEVPPDPDENIDLYGNFGDHDKDGGICPHCGGDHFAHIKYNLTEFEYYSYGCRKCGAKLNIQELIYPDNEERNQEIDYRGHSDIDEEPDYYKDADGNMPHSID